MRQGIALAVILGAMIVMMPSDGASRNPGRAQFKKLGIELKYNQWGQRGKSKLKAIERAPDLQHVPIRRLKPSRKISVELPQTLDKKMVRTKEGNPKPFNPKRIVPPGLKRRGQR